MLYEGSEDQKGRTFRNVGILF